MKKRVFSIVVLVALCLSMFSVTVWAAPSISIEKDVYEAEEAIPVSFTGVTQDLVTAGTWICVSPLGSSSETYLSWSYVRKAGDGSINLYAPNIPGKYEVRFYKDRGVSYTSLLGDLSIPIEVKAFEIPLPYLGAESFPEELIDFTPGQKDWTGIYNSESDIIAMKQEGDSVTGSYQQKSGKFVGTAQNGIIFGSWSQEPTYAIPKDAGQLVLAMHEDGSGFTGWWRYGKEGDWEKWLEGTKSDLKVSGWAFDEVIQASVNGIVPEELHGLDLTQKITRAEFAATAVKVYEKLSGKKATAQKRHPFTDTNDESVLKAYKIGIITGVSETEFAPDMLLSREEASVMLTRAYKAATQKGWKLENNDEFPLSYEKPALFADDSDISDWAKDSVYFMSANGIINGMGNQMFAPRNVTEEHKQQQYANTSREQAVIIANRLFEKFRNSTETPAE